MTKKHPDYIPIQPRYPQSTTSASATPCHPDSAPISFPTNAAMQNGGQAQSAQGQSSSAVPAWALDRPVAHAIPAPQAAASTDTRAASSKTDNQSGHQPGNLQPTQDSPIDLKDKAAAAAQMAAGGAIAAVGVPMLILPGPGVVAIAGGAALAKKGFDNFTGKATEDGSGQPGFLDEIPGADQMKDAAQAAGSLAKNAADSAKAVVVPAAAATLDAFAKGMKAGLERKN